MLFMAKKSISSLELAALVKELQFIVKGKISQIYHQEKKELFLQLHARGEGKQLLKIIPGKYLCLSNEKGDAPLRPTGFCMQLRKYLSNAFIKAIEQKKSERIVVFELEKQGDYFLIIELFSKGNIVLTDKDYKIIGSLERQIWKDRAVKQGEIYIFPEAGVNWKTMSEKELSAILQKSDRKNLATCLATEIGLGGLYAEEICKRQGIDKDKLPSEVEAKEIKLILQTIKEFIKLAEEPQGFIYENELTFFALQGEEAKEVKKTYNEAIDTIKPFAVISPYDKKIKTIEKTAEQQEEAIRDLQGKIENNTRKGEVIYEKYTPLQKLLDIVKELRKNKEWSEVAEELKKEKKIKGVNLKKKTIVIDL